MSFYGLIDAFLNADINNYPVINSLIFRLREKASDIARGSAEYVHSEKWLNIYWPMDEYLFIELATQNKFESLYKEVSSLLVEIALQQTSDIASYYGADALAEIARESCNLNFYLLNLPKQSISQKDEFITYWNISEVHQSRIYGNFTNLVRRDNGHTVRVKVGKGHSSLDEWLREVVWYGNKRGDYLHRIVD